MKIYHPFPLITTLHLLGCGEKQIPVQQLPNLTQFNLQTAGPVGLMKEKDFSIGSYPAISNMGDVAVAAITDILDAYCWYIIDKTGERMGMIELPRKQEIMAVKGGSLYAKSYNKSLYSDELTKHRVFY